LIWGDIVHFPHIQSARPDVSIVFDCDPFRLKRHVKILAQAASEKLLVAGMHLDRSGFANVLKAGQGYRIAYRENGRECRCASRTGRQAKNAGHL
jgi:hypothetical protein